MSNEEIYSRACQRHVQQCERSPRALCTGSYLYTLCVKPDASTSTSRARRALTLLNAPRLCFYIT